MENHGFVSMALAKQMDWCGLCLQGEAEREVVRVVLECCLQERLWNPYYTHLLASLTRAVKGHRITLQFCLWDHFKQARLRVPTSSSVILSVL